MGEALLELDLLEAFLQLACGAAQQRNLGPGKTHPAISLGHETCTRTFRMGFDIQRNHGGVLLIAARGQRGAYIARQGEQQVGQFNGGHRLAIEGD